MQVVELQIPGSFWDSFIYNGYLYLFTRDAEVYVYDWDKLVRALPVGDGDRVPLRHFLTRGKAWYSPEVQQLLAIPDVRSVLQAVTDRLTQSQLYLTVKQLQSAEVDAADSPIFPHTDLEAFYNTLYVSSSQGIYEWSLSGDISLDRLSDLPAFRLAAGYKNLAVAAGSDGMYEKRLINPRRGSDYSEPELVSELPCSACSWASFDLIASSGASGGYIAAFSKPDPDGEEDRQLLGVVTSEDLFLGEEGLLFGAGDLVVLATSSTLMIDTWSPYRRRVDLGVDLEKSLSGRSNLRATQLEGGVIDGTVTVFGIVVELEAGLMVVGVDGGRPLRLPEPINWRCFPRSERYINQLHATYDDHLSIYAFVDDYFLAASERGPGVRRPKRKAFG